MAQADNDTVAGLVQEAFSGDGKWNLRRLLEVLLRAAMETEVEAHVGATPHERTERRRGYRNGTKPRSLSTRVGKLSFSVPQTRNCEPYHPSMFARWQRSERALLVACAEMYFQGVSTRKVQHVLEEMCGMDISSATVSRVAAEIDEKLDVFRSRRLNRVEYRYLFIDARYENVRRNGHIVSQAVMISVGVTCEGKREILDWRIGDSESEATWSEVFRTLKDRGLKGLTLVVSDAHKGIIAAMKRHFQGVPWQRCRVHFLREMMKKVSYKAIPELMADAKAVFAGEDRAECLRRGEELAAKWETRAPAVAKMLREGLEDTLAVMAFPETHRRRLHSTNMLESLMRRLKRRTRVVGIFPNRASCERLIGAMLLETHEGWATERAAYFGMIEEG